MSRPVRDDVAAGRDLVRGFLHEIIPAVRTALCDPDDAVREVAAQAFSTLQRLIGGQAITEIVPSLLQLLRADDSAKVAMGQAGLREVMSQRPQAVVPYLLPKLTQPPINLSHARARRRRGGRRCRAAHASRLPRARSPGGDLSSGRRPPGKVVDPQLRSALVGAADAVAAAVEEDGLYYLVTECKIATAFTSPPHVRAAGANLIETLCKSCAYISPRTMRTWSSRSSASFVRRRRRSNARASAGSTHSSNHCQRSGTCFMSTRCVGNYST